MLVVVLFLYFLAFCSPLLFRVLGNRSAIPLSISAFISSFYFFKQSSAISQGQTLLEHNDWLTGLGIDLNFHLDGLSLLFAYLILGIGTLILLYAGSYLKNNPSLGRFYLIIISFMASMLGVVLSDNLISLFIFWELTSITSYFLIGFNHETEKSRKSALQGLFVTVSGGLALMAGFIFLGVVAQTYSISEILNNELNVSDHKFYLPILFCVLIGAFTKSAQFPFHFWLPNAMAAPTPVSAYLHSATMVKAGVYLLARLNPVLQSELWQTLLIAIGALTMLLGSYLAFISRDLKKMLAYSTIMALGTLVMLIGVGTQIAIGAFACFLFSHALYKGALFMLAGNIDHSAGTKDILELGGLKKRMPITFITVLIATLALAGVPPMFGFVAKELVLESLLHGFDLKSVLILIVMVTVISAALMAALALLLSIKPFFGEEKFSAKDPKDPYLFLMFGPAVLATLALFFGIFPNMFGDWLLSPVVHSIFRDSDETKLALWHGFNTPLMLSGISLFAGFLLYKVWPTIREGLANLNTTISKFGPEAGYFKFLDLIVWIANKQTKFLQNGYIDRYIIVLVMVSFSLIGYALARADGLTLDFNFDELSFFEVMIALLIVAPTIFAIVTKSRIAAVASMGGTGYFISLLFIYFSAPDLGITQLMVETLTVILLVLVLFKLPGFSILSSAKERFIDVLVAAFAGVVMLFVLKAALKIQYYTPISEYHVENSLKLAYGKNIVNVILVDFRVFDTMGEIFVLAIAAVGVFSMIKFSVHNRAEESDPKAILLGKKSKKIVKKQTAQEG